MAILEQLRNRWFLVKEHKHLEVLHRVIGFWVYLVLVWGVYRFLSPLPVWIEEIFLKAIIFGLPVFYLVLKKEKSNLQSLGISAKNLFESVYLGLALGVFFYFVGQVSNFLRYRGVLTVQDWQVTSAELGGFLLLALVTAWWEELVFMGYILQRMSSVMRHEWKAALATAVMFSLLYVPSLLIRGVTGWQFLLQMVLLFSLGLGNGILMLRTRNLAAPILAHTLWGAMVYMLA